MNDRCIAIASHFSYILGRQRTTISVSLTCSWFSVSLSFCVRMCIDTLCSCNSAHIALLLTDEVEEEEGKRIEWDAFFFFIVHFQKSNRNVNATWKERNKTKKKNSNSRRAVSKRNGYQTKDNLYTFRRFSFFNVPFVWLFDFLVWASTEIQKKWKREEKAHRVKDRNASD